MLRWLHHPAIIIGFTIASLIFIYSLHRQEQKFAQSGTAVEQLEEATQEKSQQIVEIQQELEESQSEFTQEKVIRDQLLMQKPGEYVFQVEIEPADEEHVSYNDEKETPIEAWWRLLKG